MESMHSHVIFVTLTRVNTFIPIWLGLYVEIWIETMLDSINLNTMES